MDKRPNIILLMADQMRGDCLGIAGHPDVKPPFLDALAASGTRILCRGIIPTHWPGS